MVEGTQVDQPEQGEQPARRRGRPPKHGKAMTGAERQRRSVEERREAEEGLRYLLYAAVQALARTPQARERFQGYLSGTRTGRALVEKGLGLLSETDRAAVRALLAGPGAPPVP